MDDLPALQRRFFALVTAREEISGALARFGLDDAAAAALVHGDDKLDAVGRLGIYNDMYFFRLLASLEEDFPWLATALGDDDFRALIADYLEANPPRDRALRTLGERLSVYLGDHSATVDRPWLVDLAKLEWARADVLDRADAEALTTAHLQALAPEALATLPLQALPAVTLLDLGFAVDEAAAAIESAAGTAVGVALAAQPTRLLVWRVGAAARHRRASEDEAPFLPDLVSATPPSFGAVCDRLAPGRSDEAAAQLAFTLLLGWVQAGLLRQPAS